MCHDVSNQVLQGGLFCMATGPSRPRPAPLLWGHRCVVCEVHRGRRWRLGCKLV